MNQPTNRPRVNEVTETFVRRSSGKPEERTMRDAVSANRSESYNEPVVDGETGSEPAVSGLATALFGDAPVPMTIQQIKAAQLTGRSPQAPTPVSPVHALAEPLRFAREYGDPHPSAREVLENTTTFNQPFAETVRATVLDREINDTIPDGFVRLELVSHFVPYTFKTLAIRTLRGVDIAALSQAASSQSYTDFIDVIGRCINRNIRQLTPSDMRHVMYWLRLNSYTKSPYNIPWTSRYGNENQLTVTYTDLEWVELKMTEEQYAPFKAKGIRFPVIADAEVLSGTDLTVQEKFMLERAQYLSMEHIVMREGETPLAARLRVLEEAPLELLEDIRDFAMLIDHGVRESVTMADPMFEVNAAIEHLQQAYDSLVGVAEANADDEDADVAHVSSLIDMANDIKKELDAFTLSVTPPEEGQAPNPVAVPRKEVITFNINVMSFFPRI
jgi:hypothetical protein